MATHSSTLACKIPWTEVPGGLQSMELDMTEQLAQMIDLGRLPDGTVVKNIPATAGDTGDSGLIPGSGRSPGEGDGNPLQYSCLENRMDRGAGWATVRGVAKSQT